MRSDGEALVPKAFIPGAFIPTAFVPRGSPAPEGGFTLLEVLIAFAIAALGLVVLYRGGLEGLFAARTGARMQEAVSRAQSRLDAACVTPSLTPGVNAGDDGGGFSWRTTVSRDDTRLLKPEEPESTAPPIRIDLLTVRVSVSWPGNARAREVTLVTQCLTSGPAERP